MPPWGTFVHPSSRLMTVVNCCNCILGPPSLPRRRWTGLKKFRWPTQNAFFNFIESGRRYDVVFYGDRWAMIEVIFGWFTLSMDSHWFSRKSQTLSTTLPTIHILAYIIKNAYISIRSWFAIASTMQEYFYFCTHVFSNKKIIAWVHYSCCL